MKKFLSFVFIILFLNINTFAQTKTLTDLIIKNSKFNARNQLRISYDKFDDETSIFSKDYEIRERDGHLNIISISASFKGSSLKTSIDDYIIRIAVPHYLRRYEIIYFSDEKRINQVPLSGDGKLINYKRFKMFMYFYIFSPDELNNFARANGIEFQIGGYQTATNKDFSETIRNIVSLGTLKKS